MIDARLAYEGHYSYNDAAHRKSTAIITRGYHHQLSLMMTAPRCGMIDARLADESHYMKNATNRFAQTAHKQAPI